MDRRTPERPGMEDNLSVRERQLLALAAQGYTDNAIARELGISLATVGTYWGRIRIKFGPLNRTELVAVYLREEASRTIDVLKAENEKLIEELGDQNRSNSKLKASLDLFRGLVETAPDAILLIGEDGVIEYANLEAEKLFGYPHNGLVGRSVETLVPSSLRTQHVRNREDYTSNPVRRPMGEHLATRAVRKDGSEFQMAATLSAAQTPNGLLVTCIVRDMSAQLDPRSIAREEAGRSVV